MIWENDVDDIGWTSPGPGTHHYPLVRGGALVALFFLPAGRCVTRIGCELISDLSSISYKARPESPQPEYT